MIVGYARVSTDGQTLDAQQAALREAGATRVFAEKVSGAQTDRVQLAKAIATLGAGDTLVVCKLDRLARSTRDLLNSLAAVGEAGASFKSLGDAWADTTTPHGRLMLTVLACRVRTPLDLDADERGPTTSPSSWSKVWQKAKTHCASTTRGTGETGCRRSVG